MNPFSTSLANPQGDPLSLETYSKFEKPLDYLRKVQVVEGDHGVVYCWHDPLLHETQHQAQQEALERTRDGHEQEATYVTEIRQEATG